MQHTKNSGEGLLQPPPPSPTLYHGGGINLRVRPRVKGVFLWDDPDQDQSSEIIWIMVHSFEPMNPCPELILWLILCNVIRVISD